MRSVQTKFFALLEERAEKEKMEVVVHQEWSNVGTIHLQEENGFQTWLSVPFNFSSKAHFGASLKGSPRIFEGRPNPQFAGFGASELGEAIDYLINYALARREESS